MHGARRITGSRIAIELSATILCRCLPDPGCGNPPARSGAWRLEGRRGVLGRRRVLRPIYASMTRPSPATYNATELRFAAGPDAAGASLAGLGDDESGAGLEELQNFGEASRGLQPLPSTLNNELGRARRFDHAVGWQLVRVAEHRKQGDSVAMVDRVISPIPASDMPAIETEELVQLGPREIHRSVPCPIVSER